ncbi:hypothetical protein [Mycobacterium sp. URHB0021]
MSATSAACSRHWVMVINWQGEVGSAASMAAGALAERKADMG